MLGLHLRNYYKYELFFTKNYLQFFCRTRHIKMIGTFITSLEDPEKPLLGPNYWILKKMGLILPESKLKKFAYLLLHEFVTIFVLTQYLELYVIRSDLDLVLTNLKISMLSIVCIVKSNTFVFWQKNWKQLIEYVTDADKYERNNQDIPNGKFLSSYTKYCRRVIHFYWVLVFITFASVISTPLIRYMSSASYREALKNGSEPFPHIFSSWIPFDKNTSPGTWITVLYHTFLCAYGAGIMAAYDTTIMVIMVFFGGKLQLLRERCKGMFGSNGSSVSYERAKEIISELHNVHVLLMRHTRLFNSLLSPVMFLYVVMCSLMLCASAYQLTSATNITQKVLMAEYLIFGIAQLFMFCWHSNDVLERNEQVMLGPYESQWWAVDIKQKKNIFILIEQFKIVHTYTAGPFTNLTLSTFVTILKGAYSYYTFLRK